MSPALLVDLILLVLIGLFAFIGYKKGALATLISLVGGIAAVFLALFLAKPLAAPVSENLVYDAVKAPIEESIVAFAEENGGTVDLVTEPPKELQAILDTFSIDLKLPAADANVPEKIAETIARPASETISFALVFLVLFFVFSIAVRILIRLAQKFNRIPLLGSANRALGLVLGGVRGLFFAWALASAFHLMLPGLAVSEGNLLYGFEETSTLLYRFLYQFNPITFLSSTLMNLN
ncbi:MAG: CvpA family protein [Clostridia bacterium]|nr:CvpA family protein [Clostridia bacterium]